jgi:hypothetical protein
LKWLGGFVEGVGKAFKFCRTCYITCSERFDNFDSKFILRELNLHLLQLNLIEQSLELTKEFGIKNRSFLLKLDDFDICKCLQHAPMHILIEGVCITELKNLLNYATKELKLDFEKINKRILDSDYSLTSFIRSSFNPEFDLIRTYLKKIQGLNEC